MTEVVASPCIKVCALDDDEICMGCYRSLDEIDRWMRCSNEEKKAILELAKQRELA
jgi:hypothetical protein